MDLISSACEPLPSLLLVLGVCFGMNRRECVAFLAKGEKECRDDAAAFLIAVASN